MMIAILIVLALALLICLIVAICGTVRRDQIDFNVVGVTNDRRTVEQMFALRAAHQGKTDAQYAAIFDDLDTIQQHRRLLRRGQLTLITHAEPEEQDPFRLQAG